ncbi:NACHT domain-containing protein [Micromonospora parva]|uniref:NACHT domain-containing protein n=1 Tax=Micromonospora parva TaxID=1464048 RepID=UPI00366AC30F
MTRSLPLSFKGALKLLGVHDRPGLDALNLVLGGAILASPASFAAAAFGMVDQKNEAMKLVRRLLDSASDRWSVTRGYERLELLSASHVVIVVSALFDAFAHLVGEEQYKKLEITDEEKLCALGSPLQKSGRGLLDVIMEWDAPLPRAEFGFDEESGLLQWYGQAGGRLFRFVSGLTSWQEHGRDGIREGLAEVAVSVYQEYLLGLATRAPEFALWVSFSQHSSMREALASNQRSLLEILASQVDSLQRVEALLADNGAPRAANDSCREILSRANREMLQQPVLAAEAVDAVGGLSFPSVGASYINPNFRAAISDQRSVASSEAWWGELQVRKDLDAFLASHFSSPNCTQDPLVVLGHPGAGKSLMTKILAARLPPERFTVIRVPLRRVDANAPIFNQIEQALSLETNGRLRWRDVVEESHSSLLVVILDGLDELLQASLAGRNSYLQEVAEFQRIELTQRHPVACVVTSRTVVMDQVRVPGGTSIIKLEDFDDDQVHRWLEIWNSHNHDELSAGRFRPLLAQDVAATGDLGRQPLLLTMIAVYAADPISKPLSESFSEASLYGRLLENFIGREVRKFNTASTELQLERIAEDHLWRLGVAAFAMFNRGRQDVTEASLGADLFALSGEGQIAARGETEFVRAGQETVGKFFFIHTAESDSHLDRENRRVFEFLHATFGEYLVAYHSVELIREISLSASRARRATRDYDDDLLFALLSHYPLSTRRTILGFTQELFREFSAEEVTMCHSALEYLLQNHRNRRGTERYGAYCPSGTDRVRELAAYSANLVLLRVLASRELQVPIKSFSPLNSGSAQAWSSLLAEWRAGLERPACASIFNSIDADPETATVVLRKRALGIDVLAIGEAQLSLDSSLEVALRVGFATKQNYYVSADDSPLSLLMPYLIFSMIRTNIIHGSTLSELLDDILSKKDLLKRDTSGFQVSAYISEFLRRRSGDLAYDQAFKVLQILLQVTDHIPAGAVFAVAAHPRLLEDMPILRVPARYAEVPAWVPLVLLAAERARYEEFMPLVRNLRREFERSLSIGKLWTSSREAHLAMTRRLFSLDDQPRQ